MRLEHELLIDFALFCEKRDQTDHFSERFFSLSCLRIFFSIIALRKTLKSFRSHLNSQRWQTSFGCLINFHSARVHWSDDRTARVLFTIKNISEPLVRKLTGGIDRCGLVSWRWQSSSWNLNDIRMQFHNKSRRIADHLRLNSTSNVQKTLTGRSEIYLFLFPGQHMREVICRIYGGARECFKNKSSMLKMYSYLTTSWSKRINCRHPFI